jgi:alginate O-acetyltransferase complex protein AlgI
LPGLVWAGLLDYALQLYFDFSGYSDMAIGTARMFSIRYPFNFDAPYQATSIIDFWQRWHMSLTRFIMVYIYNPISMSFARREIARTRNSYKKIVATGKGFLKLVAVPMLITMALAGVWHGYGMQYLFFGVLHGIFLTVNNAWRLLAKPRIKTAPLHAIPEGFTRAGSALLVFLCVITGQVFFRAASVRDAILVLRGSVGIHSAAVAFNPGWKGWSFTFLLLASTWIMPSSQRIVDGTVPVKLPLVGIEIPVWRPSLGWAAWACLMLIGGVYAFSSTSGFLYVQF